MREKQHAERAASKAKQAAAHAELSNIIAKYSGHGAAGSAILQMDDACRWGRITHCMPMRLVLELKFYNIHKITPLVQQGQWSGQCHGLLFPPCSLDCSNAKRRKADPFGAHYPIPFLIVGPWHWLMRP